MERAAGEPAVEHDRPGNVAERGAVLCGDRGFPVQPKLSLLSLSFGLSQYSLTVGEVGHERYSSTVVAGFSTNTDRRGWLEP